MKITFNIQNLKCGGCAATISKILASLEDIQEIKISVEESSVSFIYTNDTQLTVVRDKLKQLGYPENGEANSLGAKAKSFVSCAIGKMS